MTSKEEYTVFVQHQSEFDPVQTQFAWAGPAARWACVDLSRMYFWNNVGTERLGSQAVQAAVHLANASGKSSLSVRTWVNQGGPQPRWNIMFPLMCKLAMPQWVREKAWSVLQGSVTWVKT